MQLLQLEIGHLLQQQLDSREYEEIQENKMTRKVEDMIKFWNYNILNSFVNTIHFVVSSMWFARNLNRKRKKIIWHEQKLLKCKWEQEEKNIYQWIEHITNTCISTQWQH